MEDFQGTEEKAFVVDEVNNIIKEGQWNSNIVEQALKRLTGLNKPFKYIVTCTIMQKNGAGLHAASSCFWDNSTDGSTTYKYDSKTMYVIVNAFGLAI
ncbi:hypothetical protein BASA62_002975 [Batrachochytrium salamandrivorans]|nr:hypothetical protein BASA62_002975 [Batrachochytrium salamandrivorans]